MSWMELSFWGVSVSAMVGLGLLLPMLLLGATRNPVVGILTLGVAHFVDTLFLGGFALPLLVSVSPFDAAMLILAAASVLRWRHLNWRDPIVRWWVLATLVWIGLFLVGTVQFKTRAGVEYRTFFYLSFGVIYCLSFDFPLDRIQAVLRAAFVVALSTLTVACYRWGAELLAPGWHQWQERPGAMNWRVVNAQQTFVFVLVALAGVSALMGRAGRVAALWLVGFPAMLGAVLLLQHRTNWAVFLIALLVLFALRAGQTGGSASLTAILVLLAIVLLVGFALTSGGGFGEAMRASVEEPFERRSTMAWRLDSWREVVNSWASGGPAVWPAGRPFGAGWARFIESAGIGGSVTEVSPHNFYVTVLARGGIIGLAALLASLFLAMRQLVRLAIAPSHNTHRFNDAALLAAVLVAHAVFFITYSVVPFATVLLGVALAVASRASSESAIGLVQIDSDPERAGRLNHRPQPSEARSIPIPKVVATQHSRNES